MANKTYLKPDAEYISFYSDEEILAGDDLTVSGGVNADGDIGDGGEGWPV